MSTDHVTKRRSRGERLKGWQGLVPDARGAHTRAGLQLFNTHLTTHDALLQHGPLFGFVGFGPGLLGVVTRFGAHDIVVATRPFEQLGEIVSSHGYSHTDTTLS